MYDDRDPAQTPPSALFDFVAAWNLSAAQALIDALRAGPLKESDAPIALAADVSALTEQLTGHDIPLGRILAEAKAIARGD